MLGVIATLLLAVSGAVDDGRRIAEESKVVGGKTALARRITEPRTWTSANGETLPYRLHVPVKPVAGRKYPLVIHLHGAGSRGTDNAKQMNAGGSDFLSWMTRRDEECVFLAPQCPKGRKWVDVDWKTREHRMQETPTSYLRMAMEIVEDAMTRYPVDVDRVYVMGISMGGYATWELLQRHPGWFAAALPCCGGGDITLAGRIKGVAIWVFHGEVDSVVPVYRARSMVEALKRVGGNIRYREYPKTNHNAWTPTFTDDTVFDWLWAQRRVAADPVSAAVRRQMDDGLIAGAVVATGTREPQAFGDQCRVAKQVAMSVDSRFDIASVTKTFVAVLCARLAAQGKLDVDAPFTDYLTDHVLAKEGCAITVRDLAMHAGGFAYETVYQYTKDPDEIRAKAMSCRPKRARHERFCYSCLNYVYLGWIAEKVTGMPLDKAVKAYVLDPLGMKATAWGPVADDGTVVELPVLVELDMCVAKRPQGLSDRTIFHSGWSGQTVAIDPGTGFCGVCLTARAGDHDACIRGRAEILSLAAKQREDNR